MYLESLKDCQLRIGNYPAFIYDASGGGGIGTLLPLPVEGNYRITFNLESFTIPPLNWKTTKILGLPILPGLEITIITEKLEGFYDLKNDVFSLEFIAKFNFSISSILKAPSLLVKTNLNSQINGCIYKEQGSNLIVGSQISLVGNAKIEPTRNIFFNKFLGLPNVAKAKLNCRVVGLPT